MKKLVVLFALVAFIAVNTAPVYAVAGNSAIELAKADDEPKKDAKAEETADDKTDNKAEATSDSNSESKSEAGCESKPATSEAGCESKSATSEEAAAKTDCCAPVKKECGDDKK
jgi:hypothetical protein